MAERPESTISLVEEPQPTDQNVIYTYRKILPWLVYVDGQIYSSSLPILKLGLMKEINEVQRESSKSASDLYRHLREHYGCVHDDEKALRRFLFALNKLGKERYGRRCIKNFHPKTDVPLPGPKQDLPLPEYYDDTEEDDYFRFLQCLMEMCVQLDKDGRVTSQKLKKDLCSRQHLDLAWQDIDCTADMFTRMLKRTLVTATDNDLLAMSLGRVRAEKCLVILNEFRKITGTGQIDIEQCLRLEPLPASSSSRSSSFGRYNRKWSRSGAVQCVLCVSIAEVLLLTIAATFLSLAALSQNHPLMKVWLYENTTAILGDFQTFSTQKVTIVQDPLYREIPHIMQIYSYDQSCSRLPHQNISYHFTSDSLPKEFNRYLLKGSLLTYNICAITTSIEAVEEHMDFYILNDLEEVLNFDPNKDEHFQIHENIRLGLTHNLSNHHSVDSAWSCTPISFKVNSNGYHSVLAFLPPGKGINFADILVWHEAVLSYKVINTNSGQLSARCLGSRIHDSTQPCSISVPGNRHLPLEYKCLVAGIGSIYSPPVSQSYDVDSDRKQRFTVVNVTESSWIIGSIVFYSIAVIALITFVVVLTFTIISCKKHSLLTGSPENARLV